MVRLTVWKNEELTEEGHIRATTEPVFDEEMEDITVARMHFFTEYFHGYNGDIKDKRGNVLAPLR